MAVKTERVEMLMESRLGNVSGLHTVLRLLEQIETRIGRINSKTVSPQGFGVAGTNAATTAIRRQAGAVNELAQAEAKVARIRKTVHPPGRGGGGSLSVTSNIGPGRTKTEKFGTTTADPRALESTTTTTDFVKMEKARMAAARAKNKELDDRAKLRKRLHDAEQKERLERERDQAAQAKHVEKVHAQQAKVKSSAEADAKRELNERAKLRKALHDANERERAERERQAQAAERHAERLRNRQQRVMERARREHEAPRRRLEGALGRGFSPMGMAANAITAAGWGLAFGGVYKSAQLATSSMQTMIDVGYQTARLSQVFKGVGGSAQELTDDVLRMAAANGRSSNEAMEAAVAWARLGLTRRESNEAARVSMVAANVAELDAAAATKHLSALMNVYGLSIREVNSVLGMFNNTTNKTNVTNKDLFEGMSRAAIVAKQFQFSIAETQGILGASVSITGQTGANMGNAFKSVLTGIGNPSIQEFLRERIGVDTTVNGGQEMKDGPAILRELFIRWQELTSAERENLTVKVAGKTQANRFKAIMDSYIHSQLLAIDAQHNLTSAEKENAKILGTQQANIQGVKTEWDRLVVSQTNAKQMLLGGLSTNETLNELQLGLRNVLKLTGLIASNSHHAVFGKLMSQRRVGGFSFIPSIAQLQLFNRGVKMFDEMVQHRRDPNIFVAERHAKTAEKYGSAAAADKRKATLLRTAGDLLGTNSGNQFAKQALGALDPDRAKEIAALIDGNQLTAARAEILKQVAEAETAALLNKQKEAGFMEKSVALVDQEIQKAKESGNQKDRLIELERVREDIVGSIKRLYEEMGTGVEFEARLQSQLNILEGQRSALSNIAALFSQGMNGSDPVEQRTVRIKTLRAQLALLTRDIKEAESPGSAMKGGEGDKVISAMREERRKTIAAITDAESVDNWFTARELKRGDAVTRSAKLDTASFDVGRNEAERLLNIEKQLRARLDKGTRMSSTKEIDVNEARNAALSGLQAEADLKDTLIKKDELRVKLETDRKNLILEQKKAYHESLLMSGPGDLLRKLAVKQMVDRSNGKVGLGDFLALSENARRDVVDYTGMFQVRDIDRQLGLLGPRRTIPKMQKDDEESSRRTDFFNAKANDNLISPAARQASAALLTILPVVAQVNSSLAIFTKHVEDAFRSLPRTLQYDLSPSHPVDHSKQ